MNLLDVCVQAGFCQIRSHISIFINHQASLFMDYLQPGLLSGKIEYNELLGGKTNYLPGSKAYG